MSFQPGNAWLAKGAAVTAGLTAARDVPSAAVVAVAGVAGTAGVIAEEDPRDPRARLAALFDPGSLCPIAPLEGGGVAAGLGRVEGTPVVGYATDARRRGGALDVAGCGRIVSAVRHALAERVPVVGLWHSGGAELAEGVGSLDAVGSVFTAMVRASGRIPQISVILGPAAGGAAYGPALGDLVVISESGRVFVTGPTVVRAVTGQDVDAEQLGGSHVHSRRSGLAHRVAGSDAAAVAEARTLAGLLGCPGSFHPDGAGAGADLSALLPDNPRRGYDVRRLLPDLLDGPPLELQPDYAGSVVTALGRLTGRTVGVVANNPLRIAGCLNAESAEKAARFVRMCDSLGVPLVVLVDVPGYLPGVDQEWSGVVRRGAKLLHAFAEAVVPRVTLVTRRAYGGAYVAMNSRALGATAVFAWPGAEVAVMAASAAVDILHRRMLADAPPDQREPLRALLTEQQTRAAGGIDRAVQIGVVDEVIHPAQTRRRLAEALDQAPAANGRHTNIPL
jgi:acetyl-CoA/propionyl-CoA carboxylase carboxyl transferase subunit